MNWGKLIIISNIYKKLADLLIDLILYQNWVSESAKRHFLKSNKGLSDFDEI